MLRPETEQVGKGSNPDKERQEDSKPIQINCDDPVQMLEKQKELVSDLVGDFEKWNTWRKPYENLWNQIYRLYFSQVESSKTTTRSKIFVPIIFQVIEAAIPKMMNVIFGQERFWSADPINKADEPLAKVVELLVNYQLMQADFFIKFMDFAKQLLLYGTSYFYVYWKVTRKWVYTRTPLRSNVTILGFNLGSKITGWHEKKEYKVIERRPEIEVLDIMDVYPDPNARNEKEGRGIFILSYIDRDELAELGKGKFPVYENTDASALKEKDAQPQANRQQRLSSRGVTQPITMREGQIELLTYWGMHDLDGDGIREECQIVIGNKNTLLKAQSNPFHHQKRPIIRTTLFPIPNEWFGMGLVEPVVSLIHELNTLRRQRLDNVNMAINRMWKVLSYADVDLETLVSTPNGIILTDDMNAVEQMPTDNVTQSAYAEAQIVQNDIESTTSPKSIQGTPESGKLGRTARGAQLIIGQALEKFGTATKLVEETAIKRVIRMFHQLNLQFIDDDDILRDPGIYGSIFEQEVTPEMIRAEFRIKMLGISDIVGREGKINQIISFMGIFGKVLSPDTISTLAKKVWTLMGFDGNEVNIQAVQPMPPEGGQVQEQQQQEGALLNQVANNQTASVPPAIPK